MRKLQEVIQLLRMLNATGVVLAFPNGLRAHFGRGSEHVLMELLNKSLSHILSELYNALSPLQHDAGRVRTGLRGLAAGKGV